MNWKKIWNDPVWSKVIAGIVLGAGALMLPISSENQVAWGVVVLTLLLGGALLLWSERVPKVKQWWTSLGELWRIMLLPVWSWQVRRVHLLVAAVLIVVVTAFFLLPPPPRSGPPMVGYSHLSGLKPTQLQDGGAPRPDDIMEVWVSPTSLRTDPDSTSEKIRDLAIGTRVKVISPVKQRWIHIEVLISKGQIESPKSNAQVIQAIEVRGTVSYLQPETRLWLAVRKGPLIWPKVPYNVEVREGRWSAIVYEGDKEDKGTPPGGEFELVLLEVGSAGNNEIEEWNRIGAATSHFPGFGSIKDSRELHAIKLLKKTVG